MANSTVHMARAERKKVILRAAARVFVQQGYAAATMDAIATEAGITKAILYRHYESKQDLYEAVLQGVRERMREIGALAQPASPGAAREVIRRMLELGRQDPDGFALLFQKVSVETVSAEEFALPTALRPDDEKMEQWIKDPVMRRWAMRVMRPLIVQMLLAWLQVGATEKDEVFLDRLMALLGIIWSAQQPLGGK